MPNYLLIFIQNWRRANWDFFAKKSIRHREFRQPLFQRNSSSQSLPDFAGQTKLSFHFEKRIDRTDGQLHGGGAVHAAIGVQTEARIIQRVLVAAGKTLLLRNILNVYVPLKIYSVFDHKNKLFEHHFRVFLTRSPWSDNLV